MYDCVLRRHGCVPLTRGSVPWLSSAFLGLLTYLVRSVVSCRDALRGTE